MHFSKNPYPDKNDGKYKYSSHKERVRLKILDVGAPSFPDDEDFTNNGKVPIYEGYIPTDPLGSWTGKPENPDEEPVQDADDL